MVAYPPNGTAKWQLWVSVAGIAVVMVGAILALYVQVSSAYTTAQDLKGQVDRLNTRVAEQSAQLGTMCSSLTEIETQFSADDQIRNLMHVDELRRFSTLYRQVMGRDYPTGGLYLPTIAQERPRPC